MGIQYFYHFCVKDIDDIDLAGDILSAVRKSYFATFEKIRDKITYDSEGNSLLYDYCIEKNKPLRWVVKNMQGGLLQEVIPADNGRYYLCFYRGDMLYKRLLFSKLHTLLKAEYLNEDGSVRCALEPRKAPGGLCLLYTDAALPQPVVLSAAPAVSDEEIAARLEEEFDDFTAAASTNEGVIWFMSDEQIARYRQFVSLAESEIRQRQDETFVGDFPPLFEKINEKDFNIKRNLSASLDISQARAFGEPTEKEHSVEEELIVTDEPNEEIITEEIRETAPADAMEEAEAEPEEKPSTNPDKLIMADGAVYSYYGELDENGNRSGYGRTLTDLGRTAYEGMYYNDKRSGKGAYFYKDGTLCYSGDWSENVRHGVGVGISSRDGSMHIGRWVNNKPEGNGVRLTAEGDIKFVCKELSDGSTSLMHYLEDDRIVISKYDKDGNKVSEKTVSLVDFN